MGTYLYAGTQASYTPTSHLNLIDIYTSDGELRAHMQQQAISVTETLKRCTITIYILKDLLKNVSSAQEEKT